MVEPPGEIECSLPGLRLRRFHRDDEVQLVALADDRSIWLQVRDSFPHPYTQSDARRFLSQVSEPPWLPVYAMQWAGQLAGAIGLTAGEDINRVQAELGYWVGAPFRGQGIAQAAVTALAQCALAPGGYTGLIALPFSRNLASIQVLERCGFRLQTRLERSAIKDGVIVDQLLYSFLAERR